MSESENKATIASKDKATASASTVTTKSKTVDEPVTINKGVTIFRKENGSAYYRRNAKFIPDGKISIGSAINSIARFKSNIAEMKVYMPPILGIGADSPEFTTKFSDWCENISVKIPEIGKNLEVGFVYNSKDDADTIKGMEAAIYKKFTTAKKATSRDRDLAFNVRDQELVNLEKTKYKYGFPIKVEDYIIWRYALVYTDVANDVALINKHGGIRFYIFDKEQEAYKEKLQFDTRKKATTLYVKLFEEPERTTNILWNHMGGNVNVDAMIESDQYGAIETLSKANPNELIKLYEDPNLNTKATIERLIHYGILKRLAGTNIIVDENNDTLGNDMAGTIAYFKNKERNKEAITRLMGKLRNYTNTDG